MASASFLLTLFAILGLVVSNVAGFHHVLVGNPVRSNPPKFHYPRNSTGAMIYSLSEYNVISAMNPRTGSIVWRQSFPGDSNLGYILEGDDLLVSTGTSSPSIHMYSATTGYHKWALEQGLKEQEEIRFKDSDSIFWPLEEDFNNFTPHDIVTLSNGIVRRIDSNTGNIKWQTDLDKDSGGKLFKHELDSPYAILPPSSPDEHVTIIITNRKSSTSSYYSLSRVLLDSNDGSLVSDQQSPIPATNLKSLSKLLLFPSRLAWLNSDGTLQSINLHPSLPAKSLKATSIPHNTGPKRDIIPVNLERNGYFVALAGGEAAEILRFKDDLKSSKSGQLEIAWEYKDKVPNSAYTGTFDKKGNLYITRAMYMENMGLASLQTFSATPNEWSKGGILTGSTFPYSEKDHGKIVGVTIEVTPPTSPRLFSRHMISTSSGTLQLWQDDNLHWTREEGLAHCANKDINGIQEHANVAFLELSSDQDAIERELEDLSKLSVIDSAIKRFKRHFTSLDINTTIAWLKQHLNLSSYSNGISEYYNLSPQEQMNSPPPPVPVKTNDWMRDQFGYRKLAIMASKLGKIFAVDMATGDIVWNKLVWQPQTKKSNGIQWQNVMTITNSHTHTKSIVAVGIVKTQSGSSISLVYELDALSGKIISSPPAPASYSSASKPSVEGTNTHIFGTPHLDQLVFIDNEYKTRFYPISNHPNASSAETTTTTTNSKYEDIHYFLPNSEQDGLSGYILSRNEQSQELESIPTWTINFESQQEKISKIIKSTNDPVASLGRVLGNRKTLYKYLNPHLIIVLTANHATNTLKVYVIDVVSGSIVYSLRHVDQVDTTADVNAALSANWLVYSFKEKNTLGKPTRLVSVELFEGLDEYRDMSKDFSSYTWTQAPVGLNSSFIYPFGIKQMGITKTRFGVTTQNLLVTTSNDQVVSIPRKFLDPRRPKSKPTKEEQAEMLIPYDPLIPPDARWTLSKEARLFGSKSILSTPTILESTSIVLVLGVDIFVSTVMPSKGFDTLSDDFNKLQLFLTLFGLLTALIIVRPIVKRKQLNAKWYS